jgi:RNA polymerase sigma factor (sigma-70 family)
MNYKKPHEDQFYIDGLANNDSRIIDSIYKKFVPKVKSHIITNSGNIDDANDVVQETLITLFNQAKTSGLILTCPFDAYFFLLCKRKWINELNKKHNKEVTLQDEFVSIDKSMQDMIYQTETFDEKKSLFDEMFQKLGNKCKELLSLSFNIKSLEEVAQKLNVTYAYVRKKKSICTGELTQLIQQSAGYQTIKK